MAIEQSWALHFRESLWWRPKLSAQRCIQYLQVPPSPLDADVPPLKPLGCSPQGQEERCICLCVGHVEFEWNETFCEQSTAHVSTRHEPHSLWRLGFASEHCLSPCSQTRRTQTCQEDSFVACQCKQVSVQGLQEQLCFFFPTWRQTYLWRKWDCA